MRIFSRTSFAYGRILLSPFLSIFITTAPGPRSHPYRGPPPAPSATRGVKSRGPRARGARAVVPRVDSNSISPTQPRRGEREHCCAAFCTLPAYQSSVINLETNCRSPRRPIAERCNGPAMKGVDGTVRRRRAARSGGRKGTGIVQRTGRKANNNNNYLIRVDGGEERRGRGERGGRGRDLREFVISVMGCSTRVTCRPRLN